MIWVLVVCMKRINRCFDVVCTIEFFIFTPHAFFYNLLAFLKYYISMNYFTIIFYQILGRYSPVRRASEGSRINSQFQGALHECQQLQKGLTQPRHLLITPSPPLADNSVSLPGRENFVCNISIIFKLL